MNEIYCIYDKSTASFLEYCFETEKEAQDEICSYEDEDAYLMSIFKMTENEFVARSSLCHLYSNEEAKFIEETIEKHDNKNWIYEQLASSLDTSQEWITKKYSEHFKFALQKGGYATEEDFYAVELMSFKEFLNYLRKQIDFADDYDAACKKYKKNLKINGNIVIL
jgi:hypothetical protein